MLVGAGPMAVAYAKVLQEQKVPFLVVGRGQASAEEFEKLTGAKVVTGGIESWLEKNSTLPENVIVAVSEHNLGSATLTLLRKGVKSILVEKPGAADYSEIQLVAREAKANDARVLVGYNRRFHASTQKALKLIEADGGISSFHFEFTEWSHIISKKVCPQITKDEWFLHNSTHVVDMAFFIGGKPREMSCYAAGKLDWHPRASKYSGAGVTDSGAVFSYHANWGAPGRWSVEAMTEKHRYVFRPLEGLLVQKIGSVALEEVALDDDLDKRFKPGLYRQTEAFLAERQHQHLLTIDGQVSHLGLYASMERLNNG